MFGLGPSGQAQPRLAKVFWFFFSKKNSLASLYDKYRASRAASILPESSGGSGAR
jgi:hypothetical protein